MATLTERKLVALGQRLVAGPSPARAPTHARVRLKAEAGSNGPAWTDAAGRQNARLSAALLGLSGFSDGIEVSAGAAQQRHRRLDRPVFCGR